MKKILIILFFISAICFSGRVRTGTFYDPSKEDIGVFYVQIYKDKSNIDNYSFRITYAMGSNRGECHFYNIKNPEKGVLYGNCRYVSYDDGVGIRQGEVFKFEFLDNGNLKVNNDYIYKRSNMTEENTIKQIEYFNNN